MNADEHVCFNGLDRADWMKSVISHRQMLQDSLLLMRIFRALFICLFLGGLSAQMRAHDPGGRDHLDPGAQSSQTSTPMRSVSRSDRRFSAMVRIACRKFPSTRIQR